MQTKLPSIVYQSLCLLTGLLISYESMALKADADQPMQIEADKVILKEKQGISRYLGHVTISQGSRKIIGDSITIFASNEKVDKVIIEGKPASFSQLNDDQEIIEASSHKMTFHAQTEIMVLEINAILQQKDNIFRSEKIIYNTAKDIMTAGDKDSTDPERVKITILPQKDSNTPQ